MPDPGAEFGTLGAIQETFGYSQTLQQLNQRQWLLRLQIMSFAHIFRIGHAGHREYYCCMD